MRKREKKEKYCLNCGTLIPNRNVYCNNKCQGEYSTKTTFIKIENGDTSFNADTYKKYLIQKFGNKCMKCGWNEINPTTGLVPIQLEHKDGNSENNNLNNLELLCPNHHSLTPTYGALNKGNGRTKRQEKRIKNNFTKQWVIAKNNSIDFTQHEPISTHNSLHIYEERYEVEGETYRLLYVIGNSSKPLIEMLEK